MQIGNDGLFIELGFKADTAKLKDFIHAVGDLNMTSIMSSLGLGALYEATQKIANVADTAAMKLYNFHQQTGLPTDSLQQFSRFAEQMGASQDAVESYIRSLQDLKENYRMGNPLATYAVERVGLDVNRLDNLNYVQDKLRKFYTGAAPDIDKLRVAQELHSESVLGAYKASEKLWQSQFKLDIIRPEELESIKTQHRAWSSLRQEWVVIAAQIQTQLEPMAMALAKVLESILKYVASNEGAWTRWLVVLLGVGVAIKGIIESLRFLVLYALLYLEQLQQLVGEQLRVLVP